MICVTEFRIRCDTQAVDGYGSRCLPCRLAKSERFDMKLSRIPLTLVFLAGTSLPALAAASAEEAQRLTTALQAYFTAEPGVVTVMPGGDSYNLKLDMAPFLAKVKEPGASASLSPLEMTLTDQGGGKWKVDQDQPLSFQVKVDGVLDMKGSIASIKGTGIFDEALGTFASSSTDFAQFGFQQSVTENGVTTNVAYTIAAMHQESAMTGTGDAADGTVNATFKDLRQTVSIPGTPEAGMPPMDFSITASGGSQGGTVKGLKPRAMNDLLAWLVARPSPEAIKADQAALKDKLRAAIPLFQNVAALATADDLSVNTMMGRFGLQKLEVLVDVNGVVDDGRLQEKFSLTGLQMPDGIVPPWAAQLVPSKFTIDFNIADFNLAAPARLIIDNFDLTQQPPIKPEMEQQLMQALLPKGSVTLSLGPSQILAALFDLNAEGSMQAGPMSMPSGSANVRLKGLDDVMTALQAAPPELGIQQMAPVVMMAKGMAKADADGTLNWKIESTPDGGVLVNGVDLMKMGGGQ